MSSGLSLCSPRSSSIEGQFARTAQKMLLQDFLLCQGFGTRRACAGLTEQGFVAVTVPWANFRIGSDSPNG